MGFRCPTAVLQPTTGRGGWEYDGAIVDNEFRRHADARPWPARATTIWRLLDTVRSVPRVLLLGVTALAGVASGMLVGGGGALPLRSSPWHAPAVQAAGAELGGADRAPVRRAAALIRPTAAFDRELLDGIVLAAAMRELPVVAGAAPVPTLPAGIAAPAPAYRIELAMLRDPDHAEPVWQRFAAWLGAPAASPGAPPAGRQRQARRALSPPGRRARGCRRGRGTVRAGSRPAAIVWWCRPPPDEDVGVA